MTLNQLIISSLSGKYIKTKRNGHDPDRWFEVVRVEEIENYTGFGGCPVTTFRVYLDEKSYESHVDLGLEDEFEVRAK